MMHTAYRSITTNRHRVPKKYNLNNRIRESMPAYFLMSPSLIVFILFTAYPIIWAVKYCLYDYNGAGIALYVGLDNFKELFRFENFWGNTNSYTWLYWSSWGKTLLYTAIKLTIEMPLALGCALLIYNKVKGSGFYKTIFYMPQILPGMVMFMIFGIMLNPYNGALNMMLHNLGLIPMRYSFFRTGTSAFLTGIAIDIWNTFGINMLFFYVGLNSVPMEIYESAVVDGATKSQSFRFITLPMLARMIQVILLLALVGCLKTTGSYFILTDGGPNHATELVFLFIYYLFFPRLAGGGTTDARCGFGAAVALVSAAIIACISIIYYKISDKFQY